jgi:hypothetical protein
LDALEEGEEEEEEVGAEADETVRGNDRDVEDADRTSVAAQLREEKLQNDLFILRQLNGAFAVYNDALREAQAGTEVNWPFRLQTCPNLLYVTFLLPPSRSFFRQKHIAEQLEQTDALLNKYVNILSKTDQVARLIFDERWMGAEAVRPYLLVSTPPSSVAIFLRTSLFSSGFSGRGAARGGGTRARRGAEARGRGAAAGGAARTGAEGKGGARARDAR